MQIVKIYSLIILSSLSLFLETYPSENLNSIDQEDILIGDLEISEIENFNWFQKNYKSYSPKKETIDAIHKQLQQKDIRIEIYFGTWCSDSQIEVPSIIKLMELVNFDTSKIKLIGVNRDKVVPNVDEAKAKQLNVQMVPTFIIYKNGKELNRYVEFAQESLEQDLLSILKEEGYKHSYKF